MKKVFFLLVLLVFYVSVYAQSKRVTILFTNDIHSRLTGSAPESSYTPMTVNDDDTHGGFARMATIIKSEKERSRNTVIVADAGDFLMGTLFQSLEVRTGFQLRLMKKIGYDVAAIGNHEFDYGPEKLASIVLSAKNGGAIPSVLLGNAVFSEKETGDDSLEQLFTEGLIGRKTVLERDGIRIGFFSLLGKVADENAAYAPPVTFSKQITAARKFVKELKNDKCDLIICLSHSGVLPDNKGGWQGEDVDLAKKVKGIDLIISGHTHTRMDEPFIVKGIPIVQTGEYGQYIGRITISKDQEKVNVEEFALIPVDDAIKGDQEIDALIEAQKKSITDIILKPAGMDYDSPVAESSFLMECNELGDIENSNLGPFVADAIYDYVNDKADGGTDFSMVAVGVIRDRIVPGIQTAPDIFRLMSMGSGEDDIPGYPLARLYITGHELKNILEILQMAYKSVPANYCYYSGLRAAFNPDKGMFKKIRKIEIVRPDGSTSAVDISKKDKKLYSVTANSYMLEFISIIKKKSFGLINVVPKDANGNEVKDMKTAIIDMDSGRAGLQEGKEWLAIMHYLRSMKDINGNQIPDIDKKYSIPVRSFYIVDK